MLSVLIIEKASMKTHCLCESKIHPKQRIFMILWSGTWGQTSSLISFQLDMTLLAFMLCLRHLYHSTHAEHFRNWSHLLLWMEITFTHTESFFLLFLEYNFAAFWVLFLFSRPHFSPETLHPVLCAYFWVSSGEAEECLLGSNSDCE